VARRLPPRPFLYAIVDAGLLAGRSVGELVSALAAAGCPLVQLRAKAVDDRRRLELAREAVAAARRAGAALVVNDRPDVALLAEADGVHVGQEDLRPAEVRRLLGPDRIVGVSTHNREQLEEALGEPIDYVAVGPVFATGTKQRPDPVVGTAWVAEARRRTSLPLVAIGGITPDNAGAVIAAGADGIAAIAALLAAPDPADAARRFLTALRSGA
jgi:thiamine-phosphate pyrophosphorylase